MEYLVGTQNNPGKFDCYAKAEPDEPMFVLLGRDPHAAAAVRKWAADRATMIAEGKKPPEDIEMVNEAYECADAMDNFSARRRSRDT
jgi:hypothetical protein